jgi:RNA polymerase sigma-70 factor (ECF subfamily)
MLDTRGGVAFIVIEMTGELPISSAFQETQWSVVAIVRRMPESPEARRALAELCAAYWYPLYAFARRCGLVVEDAKDAAQSFFARIVRDNFFAAAIPEKGLLRTFLLAAFKNHITNERRRARAARRGGGMEQVPLDFGEGEDCYLREPADPATPETHFDRCWARTVMRSALESLGRQERRAGREAQFEALKGFLADAEDAEADYTAAEGSLRITPAAARTAVSRLREKYRKCVRTQIAQTLDSPDSPQVENEMTALLDALAGR